jgi:hypothetical protein
VPRCPVESSYRYSVNTHQHGGAGDDGCACLWCVNVAAAGLGFSARKNPLNCRLKAALAALLRLRCVIARTHNTPNATMPIKSRGISSNSAESLPLISQAKAQHAAIIGAQVTARRPGANLGATAPAAAAAVSTQTSTPPMKPGHGSTGGSSSGRVFVSGGSGSESGGGGGSAASGGESSSGSGSGSAGLASTQAVLIYVGAVAAALMFVAFFEQNHAFEMLEWLFSFSSSAVGLAGGGSDGVPASHLVLGACVLRARVVGRVRLRRCLCGCLRLRASVRVCDRGCHGCRRRHRHHSNN